MVFICNTYSPMFEFGRHTICDFCFVIFSLLVLLYMKSAGHFAGYYFSGDGAHRHSNGYYQITGRTDDVINVSGHRLGTAEIEDVMVSQHLLCLKY